MVLRPYQVETIRETINAINAGHKKILIILATGAGKSIIISEISKHFAGKSILCTAHRLLLTDQLAGMMSENDDVKVSTLQGAKSGEKYEVILNDEAHFANGGVLQDRIANDDAIKIGFTATPITEKGSRLKGWDYLINGVQLPELIKLGYASPIEAYIPNNVNTDDSFLIKDIVDVFKQYGVKNRKALCYCINIEHCRDVRDKFVEQGIKAEVYHSKLSKNLRESIFSKFKKGQYQVLVNVEMMTTGIDLPDVYTIILAAPIKSARKAIQIYGRVARLNPDDPNKIGVIIDCANVIKNTIHPLDMMNIADDDDGDSKPKGVEEEFKKVVKTCIFCGSEDVSQELDRTEKLLNIYSLCQGCGEKILVRSIPLITSNGMVKCIANGDSGHNNDAEFNSVAIRRALNGAKNADGKPYSSQWLAITVKELKKQGFHTNDVLDTIEFYKRKGWVLGGIVRAMNVKRSKGYAK